MSKEAVALLRRKYSKTSHPILTAPRFKMATIPARAKPLENPVGHAPAVIVKHGPCTIFSLPGVPAEMMAIFSKHVLPFLKNKMGSIVRIEKDLETKGITESLLAPYLDRVVARNPEVYIKSHPRGYRKGVSELHINLACESGSRRVANRYLRIAVKEIKRYVMYAGGRVKEI